MKTKLLVGVFTVLTILSISYAYLQRKEAETQRNQANAMHRQMLKLRQESEAARAEAAKLRGLVELERHRADEAIKQLQGKPKK